MEINIIQGNDHQLQEATVNVVIDVIRAFTVAHYAFLNGASTILLVNRVEEAFQLKQENPTLLLAGEINGVAISGFDLDNSPYRMDHADVANRTIVQKTTNGVKATLHSLNADHVFVTGFSNAKTLASYLRTLLQDKKSPIINIVASHPRSDDDLACAEYMKGIILGDIVVTKEEVVDRIYKAEVAQKFLNPSIVEFDRNDLGYCTTERYSDFVMKVNKASKIPMIERIQV